jgi:hypothetical protein
LKYFFLLFSIFLLAQKNETIISGEINIGKNVEFLNEKHFYKGITLSFGIKHNDTLKNWSNFLNNPTTGILLQYNDLNNTERVGQSFAIMPFIELPLNKKRNININLGLGISYTTSFANFETSWNNTYLSTNYNWVYRSFVYYNFFDNKSYSHRFGLGLVHLSNGHVKWPNQGLNSFVISYNTQFFKEKKQPQLTKKLDKNNKNTFYSIRTGLGFHALSRFHNNQKKVISSAFSYGKIYDNTYKLSLGFNYKFYENYYDYIIENKEVVANIYPELKEKPIYNASTYGFFINGEIMLGYVSGEIEFGINIDKPFYKVDYRVSNIDYIVDKFVIGELDNNYHIKKYVYTRLGLKTYIFNNNLKPKNNFFLGGFINANLFQADFSEISLGYVRRLN